MKEWYNKQVENIMPPLASLAWQRYKNCNDKVCVTEDSATTTAEILA